MARTIIVSNSYQAVEVALAFDGVVLNKRVLSKHDTSKLLINHIDLLLKNHDLSLKDINYLTANRGPSPFTTLRVSLTTLNGIAFASAIPIVGVDGLLTFVLEYPNLEPPVLALLNAYNNDAYYALQLPKTFPTMGCKPIQELLIDISKKITVPITVIGNGVSFFAESLNDSRWQDRFVIPKVVPHYTSIEAIAACGFQQYSDGFLEESVMPQYLKN